VDTCFCQCMGNGPCGYWNYYYRQLGQVEWVYSPLGALIHQVTPGSVEAWVWGDGRTPPDQALTFQSICGSSPAPNPTSSPVVASLTPASTLSADVSVSAAQLPPPSPAAQASPVPTPLPSSGQEGSSGEGDAAGRSPNSLIRYWPFGLMLLVLVAVAAYLRAGRRL